MTSNGPGFHRSIAQVLSSFIRSKSATFACGGHIPISNHGASKTIDDISTSPVTIRWDSPRTLTGVSKLVFPIDGSGSNQKTSLVKLVDDSQAASFGFKGEDIIDESYRKATKLDRTAFSTDFCPYELGIVDTIAQVLLPSTKSYPDTKGVKAELYKLNIYNAPSGFFKAHVDTPRSVGQFGSLVVCLPCQHEGGQLVVRHAGHSTTFDWGASGSNGKIENTIQWAAFYSDCEHEVMEVTEGHRITLTYNLFATHGIGDLAGDSPAMDVEQLPLFDKIKTALEDPDFMPEGGNLGIHCQHAYAHSTEEGAQALPYVLKGADMAVYSVFNELGLNVAVRPIFDLEDEHEFENYHPDDPYGDISITRDREMALIGKSFGKIKITDVGAFEESPGEILDQVDGYWLKVKWLNRPSSWNIGFVHMTYGNQAGINELYTSAALIIKIPEASARQDLLKHA